GMHDGQMLLVPQRFEGSHRGMQPEEAVQIDDADAVAAATGPGKGDAWTHAVVSLLGVRHNDVEPVGGAALEQHHQALATGAGSGSARGGLGSVERARQKTRYDACAHDSQRPVSQENSACDGHDVAPTKQLAISK